MAPRFGLAPRLQSGQPEFEERKVTVRVGILTEFPSPAVQSGPAIHTKFLREGLLNRGHEVVLMGPDTTSDAPDEGDASHLYYGVPWPTHPKVRIAMPGPSVSHLWNAPDVDVLHCQTNTQMSDYATWMRQMHQVPVLNTHTVHLPTHSHFVLSDGLFANDTVRNAIRRGAEATEGRFAQMYNDGDVLIVQNRFFVDYWRERGVTIPIEVVGRPIDPSKFSKQPGDDPFPAGYRNGKRLLCVCRHDREKNLNQLLDIFVQHIAPEDPEVTLTLVGDGHDHANLVERALATPFGDRINLPGEQSHEQLVDWYAHADLFVYTSVSETFGNVVNEALWCGLPVVALDDRMGVSHQVANEVNGFLIEPEREHTGEAYASAVLLLTRSETLRRQMGEQGANLSRRSSHPDVVMSRFESIYGLASEHCRATVREPLSSASRLTQMRKFAFYMSRWAWWNGALLGIAYAATKTGAGRKGGFSQHVEVEQRMATQQPTLDQRRNAA